MKILLFTILLPLSAHAGGTYCHSISELNSKVDRCEDNELYSEAGVLCLENFEAKADAAGKAAGAALNKSVKQMKSAQDKNFDTTSKSYAATEATLAALIAEGIARKAEAAAYLDNIVYPEELGEGGQDPATELMKTPCYIENQDTLQSIQEDFDTKIAELQKAAAASAALRGTTDSQSQNLDGSLNAPAANGTKKAAPSEAPNGYKDYKGSDISGTKQQPKK